MLGALHQGDFLDARASPARVLARLGEIEERLAAIGAHADQMHAHQRALDLPSDEFVALQQMRVCHDAKRDLWCVAERWSRMHEGWLACALVELCGSDVRREVAHMEKQLAALGRAASLSSA